MLRTLFMLTVISEYHCLCNDFVMHDFVIIYSNYVAKLVMCKICSQL